MLKNIEERKAMRSLAINIDSKCTASCSDCCFECSPQAKEHISNEEISHIMSYVKVHKDVRQVSITGGEPMLRREEVVEIIKLCSSLGKEVTLITNGFWAIDPEVAERTVGELVSDGLSALTVSYDEFHSEFIPVDRIRNLLSAARKFDISIALNMVVSRDRRGIKLLDELGSSVFGVPITAVPVSRAGRAKEIDEKELYFSDFNEKNMLRCPVHSWEFVIHHDGYVYPCCSPCVFESNLRVGNIRTQSIEEIENKLFSNIILYILQMEGLSWFIDKMKLSLDSEKFVSVCEICQKVFSDQDALDGIYDEVVRYYDTLAKTV